MTSNPTSVHRNIFTLPFAKLMLHSYCPIPTPTTIQTQTIVFHGTLEN